MIQKLIDKDDVQRKLKWIPVTDSEIEEIKPYEVVSDSEVEKEQEEIEKEQKSSEMSDPDSSSDEDPPEISSDSETKEEEASKVSDPMIEEEESSQFDSGSDIRSSLEDVVSLVSGCKLCILRKDFFLSGFL